MLTRINSILNITGSYSSGFGMPRTFSILMSDMTGYRFMLTYSVTWKPARWLIPVGTTLSVQLSD